LPFAGTALALGDGLAVLGDGLAADVALGEPDGARQAALAAVPPHPARRRQVSRPLVMAAVREGATAHRLRCPGEL
jgi:hypothetical protein